MRKLLFVLSLLFVFVLDGNAQFSRKNGSEIRIFASDATVFGSDNNISRDITKIIGSNKVSSSESGMFGFGYRFNFMKLSLGFDVSYSTSKTISQLFDSVTDDCKRENKMFLIMPTFELTYFNLGIIELYGAAGVGVLFTKSDFKSLSTAGESLINGFTKTKFNDFSYQFNPLCARVGLGGLGIFAELGYGYKGYATLGLDYRF